jgi:hypothetical protein
MLHRAGRHCPWRCPMSTCANPQSMLRVCNCSVQVGGVCSVQVQRVSERGGVGVALSCWLALVVPGFDAL